MNDKVYIFLAEGFEEIETITPIDILRRAEIECITVSTSNNIEVTGGHGITIKADELFNENSYKEARAIILPGGGKGVENLKAHEGLKKVIHYFNNNKRLIAAICAAPTILGELKILEGKRAVCYPGLEDKLIGAKVEHHMYCYDGHILTSRGAGTAMPFALKLVEILKDDYTKDQIKNSIVY